MSVVTDDRPIFMLPAWRQGCAVGCVCGLPVEVPTPAHAFDPHSDPEMEARLMLCGRTIMCAIAATEGDHVGMIACPRSFVVMVCCPQVATYILDDAGNEEE